MEDLSRLPDLECLRLLVVWIINSLKAWSLEAEQKLNAVQYGLPLCDMRKGPKCLRLIFSIVLGESVDLVDTALKLFQQVERLAIAGLLRVVTTLSFHLLG